MASIEFVEAFKKRTKEFAIRIIRLYQSLPKTGECQVIGKQMLRSGTSIAANYRAACRSRSQAEFLAKIGIVVEEADETALWIELLVDANLIKKEKVESLLDEAYQILSIVSTARKTAKINITKKQ